MNFAFGILVYLIFFLIFLYIFSKYGMGLFSALTITALFLAIILLLVIPPSEIEHQIDIYFNDKPHKKAKNWIVLIYLLIMILTLILISAYIIFKAYEDRRRRVGIYGENYICTFNDFW